MKKLKLIMLLPVFLPLSFCSTEGVDLPYYHMVIFMDQEDAWNKEILEDHIKPLFQKLLARAEFNHAPFSINTYLIGEKNNYGNCIGCYRLKREDIQRMQESDYAVDDITDEFEAEFLKDLAKTSKENSSSRIISSLEPLRRELKRCKAGLGKGKGEEMYVFYLSDMIERVGVYDKDKGMFPFVNPNCNCFHDRVIEMAKIDRRTENSWTDRDIIQPYKRTPTTTIPNIHIYRRYNKDGIAPGPSGQGFKMVQEYWDSLFLKLEMEVVWDNDPFEGVEMIPFE